MKKKFNKGFMLIETLIVTTFVAGVLIFLLIQFITLNENYDNSYNYNTVEDIYALRNVSDYILTDDTALDIIKSTIPNDGYIDITDCSIFTEKEYCLKLFELEDIKYIFVTQNNVNDDLFSHYNDGLKKFIKKINFTGEEEYRILVQFNDSKYATLRFGD